MVTCDLCGKEVKTAQGLRGHKTFIHGIAGSNTQKSVIHITGSNTEKQPVARLATDKQVSLVEDRLSKLERVTGLRESEPNDLLNDLLSNTEPLSNRLKNVAEQVTKLSDTVSKLSHDVELAKVSKLAEQDSSLEELRETFELELNSLAAVVNKYRVDFNYESAGMKSRIDKVQKMIENLGEDLSAVRTKLANHSHDGVNKKPELDSKVKDLGTKMAELESTVKSIKKRVPVTPYKFRKLKLTDGTEHTYTLYRGPWGLSLPRKIEDGEYIDLTEPED